MRKVTIIFSLLLAHEMLAAQAAVKLDDLLAGIDANPVVKQYDAAVSALDANVAGARSWAAPEVGAGLFMTPYDPGRIANKNGMTGMGSFMISAKQMFPNAGQLDAEQAYRESLSQVEKENRQTTRNDLRAQVRALYWQWVILEKKQHLLDDNEKLLRFMIEGAEIRYKNGLGKISAYYKAKAALAELEAKRVELDAAIQRKKIALNTLLYRDRATDFVIDTSATWELPTEGLPDTAVLSRQRGDVQALEQQQRINVLAQQVEEAGLKPQFGIQYDHMIPLSTRPWQFSVMAMVKLPMVGWSSRAAKARIKSLQWKNEALEQQREAVLNKASGQVEDQLEAIRAQQKKIRLYEAQVLPALRKNYQTMQLAYAQNTEELFNLFDAWEALNMTGMDYLDQLQAMWMAQVDLQHVLQQ